MPAASSVPATLLAFLPEDLVGTVERVEPIAFGLSGAAVYGVTTSHGARVLRVQGREMVEGAFAQQLRILRRAADAGVAPAILHVDEAARAIVSVRVPGVPIAAAFADPAQRGPLFASITDRLRVLHAINPAGIDERDPFPYIQAAWEESHDRPGFPPWAMCLPQTIESIAATLAGDRRRVVSHNDLNPLNVIWDGAAAWLVDWEVAGLGHPDHDFAMLALFLRLGDEVVFELVDRHDGAPPDERSRASFRALRQLAGLLCGLTLLGRVDDLNVRPAPTLADAPSLGACYEGMRAGKLDLQSPLGRASLGLALLGQGITATDG